MQPDMKPGVLVADDDCLVRILLQLALERGGFEVWAAADGREAVRLYQLHQDRIDVVLLDVNMPTMDGPQALDALRELDGEVTACFITGHVGTYNVEQLRARGAAQVFTKPFRPLELADELRRLAGMDSQVVPTADDFGK